MFLRKMRWLCAAIVASVAALATPAQSKADTLIQITEIGTGETMTFSSGSAIGYTTTPAFSTTNYKNITVSVNPQTGGGVGDGFSTGALTSTVNAAILSGFNPDSSLQVIVTSSPDFTSPSGFSNAFPGEPAAFLNQANNSSALFGATVNVKGTTELLNPGGSFNAASAESVNGTTTEGASSSLPDSYAIKQTITLRVTPIGGTISPGTLGGTISSNVQTNAAPVPAPAGLVLALTAIPALGLRRILRRKTA